MNRVNKKFGSWTESHTQWLIHQMELRARYCGNFDFITFIWEFQKGSLIGSIVNIRNECLVLWFHGELIVARNKQIGREPLRGSRDLFVPRYESFAINPEKDTYSLNKQLRNFSNTRQIIHGRTIKWTEMWGKVRTMEEPIGMRPGWQRRCLTDAKYKKSIFG